MFNGINIVGGAGTGAGRYDRRWSAADRGGTTSSGATASLLKNNLANGNYVALATSLYTLNYAASTQSRSACHSGTRQGCGAALQQLRRKLHRGQPTIQHRHVTDESRQHQLSLAANAGNDAAHRRRELQATYTWGKLIGNNGTYRLPFDRRGDYTLQTGDIRHQFRTNGTFTIPAGPGQLLLGKSHGVMARAIEGWQLGWIVDLESGTPTIITAQNMLYGNGVPDKVGTFNPNAGKSVGKTAPSPETTSTVPTPLFPIPSAPQIAASLKSSCTLQAIADSSGNIVLQNPKPGTRGNLGQNVIQNPGMWSLNTSMSKSFHLREQMNFKFRVDATNLLNRPTPANPNLNIDSTTTPFGNIATKTGNRTIQGVLRLEF